MNSIVYTCVAWGFTETVVIIVYVNVIITVFQVSVVTILDNGSVIFSLKINVIIKYYEFIYNII